MQDDRIRVGTSDEVAAQIRTLRDENGRLSAWLSRIDEMTNNPPIRAAVRDALAGLEVPE